jgi:3-dehydroquinate dehydratase-1
MAATLNVGGCEVGRIPRVVGSVYTRSGLDAFARAPRPECDLVEVRLDAMGVNTPGWLEDCRALEAAGYPVILTLRSAREGGKWSGPGTARARVYHSALAVVSGVDTELGAADAAAVVQAARETGKTAILSFHDFTRTPPLDELQERVRESVKHGEVITKIAAMVGDERDATILAHLLDPPAAPCLCIMGMGEAAERTRWEFPARGSCLTYGYLDQPGAPGQPPAALLVDRLSSGIPAYAAERALRRA